MKRNPFRPLGRFASDQSGVSAIEFALLAPLMIGFYLGMGELCQGYMAQKRMAHTASSVANIVAQTTAISSDELDDVMAIGGLIMKPFPTTKLSVRISSVTRDANGVAKVDWSRATGPNLVAHQPKAVVVVPAGLIVNGASAVMAETAYDYASPVKYLMPAVTKFSSTFYELPRKVPQVPCSNC